MKKVFTFLMALCLSAGAFAIPQFEEKPQLNFDLLPALPIEDELAAEVEAEAKAQLPKLLVSDPNMLTKMPVAPKNHIRKASKSDTTKIAIDSISAMYMGTYYYYAYSSSVPAWQLTMTNLQGDTLALYFVGYSVQYIEGYYRNVQGTIQMAGQAPVKVTGTLQIDWKAAGTTTSPTYTFAATMTDSIGTPYAISSEFAFDNNRGMEVFDYYCYMMFIQYYIAYLQYKTQQYYQYAMYYYQYSFLALKDAQVTPSTEPATEFVITESVSKSYYSEGNYWVISGQDENIFNKVGFYCDSFDDPTGEYSTKDFYLRYVKLYGFDDKDSAIQVEIYKPESMVVTQSGDTTYYTETVIGRDGNRYKISMFYVEPKATEVVKLYTYGNFNDYIAEDGIFMGSGIGMAADSSYSVYASFAVNSTSVADTTRYTTKDSYNGGYYDYVTITTKTDTAYYLPVVDTIRIIEVKGSKKDTIDYVALIQYKAQNYNDPSDVKLFQITMALVSMYKYDNTVAVSQTFEESTDLITLDTSNYKSYGIIYLYAQKADKSDIFVGEIIPSKLDATYTLPLGEYAINNSEDTTTMYASNGYSLTKGSIYPTYYATFKDQMIDQMWCIVSGTFTVEATKMVLIGKNSKGMDVTLTFNKKLSAISTIVEDTQVKATKVISNGQLVIIKNGKAYNVMGAEIAQ